MEGKEIVFDWYAFDADQVPVFQNGGIPTSFPQVHQSHFADAIGFGNMMLNLQSDRDCAIANTLHPYLIMDAQECPACSGATVIHSDVLGLSGGTVTSTCKKCDGTGRFVTISPNKIFQRKESGLEGMGQTSRPPVEYASPDPSILQEGRETADGYKASYREALCLYDKKGNQAESGYAVNLQLGPLRSKLNQMGPQIWNNYEKIVNAFQSYLAPSAPPAVVQQPIQYKLVSEKETIEYISSIYKQPILPSMRQQAINNYFNEFVGEQSPIRRTISILETVDVLLFYTLDEKDKALKNGGANQAQYITSIQGEAIVQRLIKENPEADDMQITNMFRAEIMIVITELLPSPTDDNLPEVSPEQLEAQARLRGSVGGVQGILGIQSGVAQGTTDYTAAIETLIEIYGFNRETAIRVLGTPSETPDNPQNIEE